MKPLGRHSCAVDGCPNEAKKGGLCWGHDKLKRLGKPYNVQLKDPKGGTTAARGFLAARRLLRKSAINFAECDGDEQVFQRFDWNLGYAARQYVANLPVRSLEALGLMRIPGIRPPRG